MTENEEEHEQTITSESEEALPAVPGTEQSKVSLHIYMPTEEYGRVKKWARYATIEGLIEGHPRGNFVAYANFCFNLGEQYLRQHILQKRGFK
ncbi:hypothetical protein LCGC14_0262960 [marine sediment metagenome]|uniref:Uncharacterized protein n=1 Tax=marine sediment metagenome TaxID=412755 RepID=A0A0F9UI29_9ZZZZ